MDEKDGIVVYNKLFNHMHVHTEFSWLDGAITVERWARRCAELGMYMVMTDHGNLCGTVKAYKAAKKFGVKFIRGVEIYVEKKSQTDDDDDYENGYYHLVCWPCSQEGYENINMLSSLAYTEGLGKRPVVKKEFLKQYSEGIVASSACMFGEISSNIWMEYPYLTLLDGKRQGLSEKFLTVARKMIQMKLFKKKKKVVIEDYTDEDVLRTVLTKKKLQKLKNFLLSHCSNVSNQKIVEIATSNDEYMRLLTETVSYYESLFEHFYLEIQDHGFEEQRMTTLICKHLYDSGLSRSKLLITNDCHYLDKDDWEVQDALICIGTGKQLDDPTRWRFNKHELYFKTYEEMMQCFPYLEKEKVAEYLHNSIEALEICGQYEMTLKEKFYPQFDIPEGFQDSDEFLLYKVIEGARSLSDIMGKKFRYRFFKFIEHKKAWKIINEKIDFDTAFALVKDTSKQKQILGLIDNGIKVAAKQLLDESCADNGYRLSEKLYAKYLEALERTVYEYSIMRIKHISDYFLITQKIIEMCHEHGIMTGPGRGSAAGSVISYMLGITELDPIDYSLLFERFINPERESYPDIDNDVEQRFHSFVKRICSEFFGEDSTCGVNAFGRLKDKKAAQDSFRIHGFTPAEGLAVSKIIKDTKEKTLKEYVLEEKAFKERYENEPKFRQALEMAERINGIARQPQSHAAGLLIVPKTINMFKKMPVMLVGKDKVLNTQIDKEDVEEAGFLKMDILGLRNLDIIKDSGEMIRKFRGIPFDIRSIPLDDANTYALYAAGETDFVFQVESGGMKAFFKELKANSIEDITVGLAGYRPGPMDYLPEFIKVKNGVKEAYYSHEKLKPILEVTGGIPFYQEQIQQIFKDLAGYSLGRADLVRRALGKKKKYILDEEKKNFIHGIDNEDGTIDVPGCIRNGIDETTAEAIYEMILPFADYGLTKIA